MLTFLPFSPGSGVVGPELTDPRGELRDPRGEDLEAPSFFLMKLIAPEDLGTSTFERFSVLTLLGNTLPVTELGMAMVMRVWYPARR